MSEPLTATWITTGVGAGRFGMVNFATGRNEPGWFGSLGAGIGGNGGSCWAIHPVEDEQGERGHRQMLDSMSLAATSARITQMGAEEGHYVVLESIRHGAGVRA